MGRQFPLCRFFIWMWHKFRIVVLTLFWVLGFLSGILSALAADDYLPLLMRSAIYSTVSISGLLISTVLPFLISVLAVLASEFWLLPLIGGAKAFCFAFSACGISLVFGSSSWLLRGLFLFCDFFTLPMLYFFTLRSLSGENQRHLTLWLLLPSVIATLNYGFVSPFLVDLFR